MHNLGFNIGSVCILLALLVSIFFNWRQVSAANDQIATKEQERAALYSETIELPPIVAPVVVTDARAAEPSAPALVTTEQAPAPVVEDLAPVATPNSASFVHLTVPFTSQAPEKNWDQPWQDACEEAAILMLDAYYKGYNLSPLFARDELLKQVAWQEAQGWGGSIDIVDIKDASAWFMQESINNFQIIRYPEVDDIKAALVDGNPVLAVADGTTLQNPHFTAGGPEYHALLIIGYDDTNGEFITNDPGTQHGKDFRYEYGAFMDSIRDWNNGDVKNGVPVVLVRD